MGNPVVHFEIRAEDPDAAREFYGKLFGWTFPAGGIPGYTYVETGVPDAIPGGIGPTQGGSDLVTVFIGRRGRRGDAAGGGAARRHDRAAGHQVPGVTFGLFADPAGHVVGVAAQD